MAELVAVTDLDQALSADSAFDAVVLVAASLGEISHPALKAPIARIASVDQQLDQVVSLTAAPELAGGRLVLAPVGPLTNDYDDVRKFADAATDGIRRARDAGAKQPLLVVGPAPELDGDADFQAIDRGCERIAISGVDGDNGRLAALFFDQSLCFGQQAIAVRSTACSELWYSAIRACLAARPVVRRHDQFSRICCHLYLV